MGAATFAIILVCLRMCFAAPSCGASFTTPTAYVISLNQTRWLRTRSILQTYGITAEKLSPVPCNTSSLQNDGRFVEFPHLQRFEKTLSNKFSHRLALLLIGTDANLADDAWAFIFEDDVAFVDNISADQFSAALQQTMLMASDVGFIYLGICNPRCGPHSTTAGGIKVQHCSGACAHAYAVTKRRALWLYDDLRAVHPVSSENNTDYYYMDVQFLYGFRGLPFEQQPLLLGSDVHQPGTSPDWFGVVFQDWVTFPSELGCPACTPQSSDVHM